VLITAYSLVVVDDMAGEASARCLFAQGRIGAAPPVGATTKRDGRRRG
jgi:hypothetical protein